MQSTRQHILDTLDQRGSASAQQLAQSFGMTAANVRRHLGILLNRGQVVRVAQRLKSSRGRPEQVYALAALVGGSGLEPLTRALLTNLAANTEGSASSDKLRDVAKEMLGKQPAPRGQLTQRLVAAVQQLSPLNYKAHWEAKPQGPELVLGRCPYAAIIADHPELCQMDAHLLESLLGNSVEQTAKLQTGPQGTPQCVFKITQSLPRG
jgi:predicted ArsR family transcriptional regulator